MRRRHLFLVLVVVAAAVGTGLGFRDDAGRRAPVTGTPVMVHADRGVSEREVAVANAGVDAADRWLRLRFGHTVTRPTRLRLTRHRACDNPHHPTSVAWARAGLVCVRAGRPGWRQLTAGDGTPAVDVVAHEVVHVAQSELGCTERPGRERFLWITEGTAVYGAREAMVMAGRSTDRMTRRWIRENGGDLPARPWLSTFERHAGDPPQYQLWHRAIRELTTRRGPQSLGSFCAAVGGGRPWRAAFAAAFGITVDRFYADFELRRRGG